MNLHNKNVLEYVEIVGSEPKSMLHDNEGHSIATAYIMEDLVISLSGRKNRKLLYFQRTNK